MPTDSPLLLLLNFFFFKFCDFFFTISFYVQIVNIKKKEKNADRPTKWNPG